MKTYKVIYSIENQPGRKVTFVQADNEIAARHATYREFGGRSSFDTKVTIWEVKEV